MLAILTGKGRHTRADSCRRPGHPEERRYPARAAGRQPGKIRRPRHGRPGAARPRPAHRPTPMRAPAAGPRWRHSVHRPQRRGGTETWPSVPDPDLSIKPQARSHLRPERQAQPGTRGGRAPSRTARPGRRPSRPPGRCRCERFLPCRTETSGFPAVGRGPPRPGLYQDMTFLYAAVERPGSPARRSRGSA